ncbi:hypothetical protein PI125_g22204 [Phytophthora idaei]|nr:hypothetical protein PI125_g22204 [Phytophthora idaei]KAG3128827.1 hypothetical protein PI126_g21219 [Phytophthora idaei]
MVLQWQDTGNHYQTVTYAEERFKQYCVQLEDMVQVRNAVSRHHGYTSLDAVLYDPGKTAKVAARELKSIRRAAKNAAANNVAENARAEGDRWRNAGDPAWRSENQIPSDLTVDANKEGPQEDKEEEEQTTGGEGDRNNGQESRENHEVRRESNEVIAFARYPPTIHMKMLERSSPCGKEGKAVRRGFKWGREDYHDL